MRSPAREMRFFKNGFLRMDLRNHSHTISVYRIDPAEAVSQNNLLDTVNISCEDGHCQFLRLLMGDFIQCSFETVDTAQGRRDLIERNIHIHKDKPIAAPHTTVTERPLVVKGGAQVSSRSIRGRESAADLQYWQQDDRVRYTRRRRTGYTRRLPSPTRAPHKPTLYLLNASLRRGVCVSGAVVGAVLVQCRAKR